MMMESCSISAKEGEGETTKIPNWLVLHQRLSTVHVVTKACLVCSLWWDIHKDPLMWHTFYMGDRDLYPHCKVVLAEICRYPVERSSGPLEDIDIDKFSTDIFLNA